MEVHVVSPFSRKSSAFRLSDLRAAATRLYVLIAWLHVPAVAIIALDAHNPWIASTLVLAAVAVVATIAARVLPDGVALRLTMAGALTAAPILFVYAGRGAYQIDYHMYFFAVYAMLVGYVDWRPIVFAAGLTAVHHLLLDQFVPADVFPQEGLDRVALHVITVVAECTVLIWITQTIQALFTRIDALMDFTAQATAEAIADAQAENDRLRSQLTKA
ncbi:MAG TPA: hypothetical protein VFN49_07260 [Candidatus Aquilonibacter sp.]|nr:hypothetical protein [Candidatus Aquilonibacter sp.]